MKFTAPLMNRSLLSWEQLPGVWRPAAGKGGEVAAGTLYDGILKKDWEKKGSASSAGFFLLGGFARRAFSLVEVTMALGIVSFSLLAIAGLLPAGLTTFRQAMNQTSEGLILQQMSGKILLVPSSQLAGRYGNKSFYYDDEGVETESPKAFYTVKTSLADSVFPGVTNAPAAMADSFRMVRIDIVKASENTTNRFNLPVANSGN